MIGVASVRKILTRPGLSHPLGSFKRMDFTGVCISCFVIEVFKQELLRGVEHIMPSLGVPVWAGRLGCEKTGRRLIRLKNRRSYESF